MSVKTIKQVLGKHNLKCSDLAVMLNVSRAQVSHWIKQNRMMIKTGKNQYRMIKLYQSINVRSVK